VLYFTYWFPDAHRARINSGFTLALPIAVASGAPVSTALLGLSGLFGLRGWQIMYITEAIPTVLIGIIAFFYLTDRPRDAHWLNNEEKDWLEHTIGHEQRSIHAHHGIGVLRSFFDPKVLLLSLNYIGIVTASLGLLLFLPQIIKQLGVTNMQVGWLTMIPYIFGAISMVVCGWISDHIGDRRWSLFTTCRDVVVVGWHRDRRDRLLWHQGTVLVDADNVPDRPRGGCGHRLDQLARQSRRLLWPVDCRLGQAAERQLCRRALRAGVVRAGLRRRVAVRIKDPQRRHRRAQNRSLRRGVTDPVVPQSRRMG
jgi:MFS family permease